MIRDYILLALGCLAVGIVLAVGVIAGSLYLRIDLNENLWILGIPAVFTIVLNITAVEVYRNIRKKK